MKVMASSIAKLRLSSFLQLVRELHSYRLCTLQALLAGHVLINEYNVEVN